MTISPKTVRVLLIVGLATNPLACVLAGLMVNLLAAYLVASLFREACRRQLTVMVRKPRPTPAVRLIPQPSAPPKTIVDCPILVPSEQDKEKALDAVEQYVRRARRPIPMASQARVVPAPMPKKGRIPSAKKLATMTAPDLLVLGRSLGIKGLSTQMRRETLVGRIRAVDV